MFECVYCGGLMIKDNLCAVCKNHLHKKCTHAHFEYWSDSPLTHDIEEELEVKQCQ